MRSFVLHACIEKCETSQFRAICPVLKQYVSREQISSFYSRLAGLAISVSVFALDNRNAYLGILFGELKAAPTDAWTLVGSLCTAIGFFSLVGYQFEVHVLDWLVNSYRMYVTQVLQIIFGSIGLELSQFASGILAWFFILYAMFLRGRRLSYFFVDVSSYANGINIFFWTYLAISGPMYFLSEATFESRIEYVLCIVVAAVYGAFIALAYSKLSRIVDWSLPFKADYGKPIYVIFVLLIAISGAILATLVVPFGENSAFIDTNLLLALVIFIPYLSIITTIALYLFSLNVYIAVAVPRAFFGAAIMISGLIGADMIIG